MKKFLIEVSLEKAEDRRNSGISAENEEVYRHWSPTSQRYAPVDVLLQYLYAGWKPNDTVAIEEFHYGGARYTRIYYFRLVYLEDCLWMPVLENPVVMQLIRDQGLNWHQAAPNCATGTEGQCQGCSESSGKGETTKCCHDGCTCAENSALHCCCTSRLLPSA